MKTLFLFLVFCSLFLYPLSISYAQLSYLPGDWTSYRDFRYARSLDAGSHSLFVATTGGILEYQLFRGVWYDPVAVGYGPSAAVPINDPILLFFDDPQQKLWVATQTELLVFDLGMEQWSITDRDKWPQGSRVVNIGVKDREIFVETIPELTYPRLFTLDSPLPEPEWRSSVTRYKGSRFYGGLMLDLQPGDPEGVRWRGLRSKVPLREDEMRGALGMLPANFPALFPPDNYTFQADGTLLDPVQRPLPITDWIVDEHGYFWTTHWGAGILRSDLRTLRGAFYQAGLAGNDVRAILVDDHGYWFGGLNSHERQGITRANSDLVTWSVFDRRDDSRIRSTDIFDFAHWSGQVWLATNDGLLSYDEETQEWRRYDVKDNLFANEIRALAATDSELWIGTVRGLVVMTRGRQVWRIANTGLELSGINDIALAGDTVFVGTENGLFKGSCSTREFQFGGLDPGLLNAPVVEISSYGSEVWLATPDGVMRYVPGQGESKSWLAQEWLQNSVPTCITAHEQFVWVGTDGGGLYRYRKESGEWISYTTKDGLLSNHIQTIRIDGRDLLIGTNEGLTRFWWNRPGQLR